MALYRRTRNTRVLVISLVMASLLTITIDYRGGQSGPLEAAGRGAFAVVGVFQDAVSRAFRPIGSFVEGIVHIGSLQAENERLKGQLRVAQDQAAKYVAAEREREILANFFHLQDTTSLHGPVALVTGQAPGNFEWSITIDKGSSDGIQRDDPAVTVVSTTQGDQVGALVGHVITVTPNASKVLLVIDPDSKVGGRLASSGETGVIAGHTDRQDLAMDIFSTDVKVFPDEPVQTSGTEQGSIYPPGILIGYVSHSAPQPGALGTTIRLRPATEFSALEYVMVVTNSRRSAPVAGGP
jgi:rod shape-determining protein MreC